MGIWVFSLILPAKYFKGFKGLFISYPMIGGSFYIL